ncbi:centromere protein H-like [Oscarella lobularis]|uniref:centromere protein H-like n=1 Tax=Oscarella lobularis TaxID=121494 RepID=UPI0033144B01
MEVEIGDTAGGVTASNAWEAVKEATEIWKQREKQPQTEEDPCVELQRTKTELLKTRMRLEVEKRARAYFDASTAEEPPDEEERMKAEKEREERIAQYGKEISSLTTEFEKNSFLFRRVQENHAAALATFSREGKLPSTAQKICEECRKESRLSASVMIAVEELSAVQDSIFETEKQCSDLLKENRDGFAEMRDVTLSKQTPSESKSASQCEEIDLLIMRRQSLQNLIAGSGISWMTDPTLKSLMISLGEELS